MSWQPGQSQLSATSALSGFRLAVVVSHPTQYYSPWFRWIAAHCPIDLRVFYLWDFGITPQRDPRFGTTFSWDVDLVSGYAWEQVPNRSKHPGTERFSGLDNPSLWARLKPWRPDAILLFGYAYRSHLSLVARARLAGIPLVFRGDSHLLGREQRGFGKRLLLGLLYRQFAALTYVGKANRTYFRTFGIPPGRLFFAPHAVNAAHFDPCDPATCATADAVRSSLGISREDRVILFAGKLHPDKDPMGLLEAFLTHAGPNRVLVFAGDGKDADALRRRSAQAPGARVHFLPFANQSEMPGRYLTGDVFCLPSRGLYETWGLAVNEAMHMGRPCIVSNLVGCQQDLVEEGATGWVFPAGDRDALGAALERAFAADLSVFSRRARERVADYSYASAADGLLKALKSLHRRGTGP